MIMRRRPLLRAAVVGGTAYHVGKRSAEASAYREQEAAEQYAPQYAAPPAPAPPAPSVDPQVDKIQQLAKLHDTGVLTDEEFAQAKARILGV